jgi:hypothetical protein
MTSLTPTPDLTADLADALRARLLLVSGGDDAEALTVSAKPTPNAKAPTPRHLSLGPLRAALAASPDAWGQRRLLCSFADGVAAAALAPRQVTVQELAFETIAGRILMRLEGPLFIEGMRAADAEAPAHQPWHDGLHIVYWLDTDRGQRPLPQSRFAAWGITLDQLHCAARSILFHRSRHADLAPLPAFPTVERLSVGDGFDAARALVLEEIDWQRAADGLRVAIPDAATLLIQPLSAPAADLRAAAEALHAAAAHPLSAACFTQRGSKLTPL